GRLAEIGHGLGLLDDEQLERSRARWAQVEAEERRLARVSVTVAGGTEAPRAVRALDWLARPEGRYESLGALGVEPALPRSLWPALEVRARYRGYLERPQRPAASPAAPGPERRPGRAR